MQATIEQTGLPDALRPYYEKLVKAFAVAYPVTWTSEGDDEEEGGAYRDAHQPAAIGDILVFAIHRHLRNRRIGYLYRESITRNSRVVLGKASKVGAKLAHFSNLEFLIEINWLAWGGLTARQRIALVDHELSHCGTEDTDDGQKLVLISHDVEEFSAIVQRWGLWQPDLAAFAKVAAQIDLWQEPPVHVDADARQEILASIESGK